MERVSTVTLTNSIQIQLQVLCRHFASLTAADYTVREGFGFRWIITTENR